MKTLGLRRIGAVRGVHTEYSARENKISKIRSATTLLLPTHPLCRLARAPSRGVGRGAQHAAGGGRRGRRGLGSPARPREEAWGEREREHDNISCTEKVRRKSCNETRSTCAGENTNTMRETSSTISLNENRKGNRTAALRAAAPASGAAHPCPVSRLQAHWGGGGLEENQSRGKSVRQLEKVKRISTNCCTGTTERGQEM